MEVNGGARNWTECPGSGQEARWIAHPVASEIEIPICAVCGKNGIKTTSAGNVPRHVDIKARQARDYAAEFERRKERKESGEDIRL